MRDIDNDTYLDYSHRKHPKTVYGEVSMTTVPTIELILNQQKKWAEQNRIAVDKKGYTLSLASNLFLPLLPETWAEFAAGSGHELNGGADVPARMQALHSDSALFVNVFEYWRQNKRIAAVASACGSPPGITAMSFESKCKIFEAGPPPHLDIIFSGESVRPLALEAKFTGPYRPVTQRNNTNLQPYLADDAIWTWLPECKKLAAHVLGQEGKKTDWLHLDIPQLLKHFLGLTCTFGPRKFELLYLWYDFPSAEAGKHREEIEKFKKIIGGEALFRDLTYQNLFNNILAVPGVDPKYTAYLGERYFSQHSY